MELADQLVAMFQFVSASARPDRRFIRHWKTEATNDPRPIGVSVPHQFVSARSTTSRLHHVFVVHWRLRNALNLSHVEFTDSIIVSQPANALPLAARTRHICNTLSKWTKNLTNAHFLQQQ